jgi:hypothetical protein
MRSVFSIFVCGLALAAIAAQVASDAADTPSVDAGFPASGAPYIAAYRWGAANKTGGALANEAYARWLNRKVVGQRTSSRMNAGITISRAEAGSWESGRNGRKPFPAGV